MILTSYSQIKQDLLWKENDVINIIVYTWYKFICLKTN
jgi:hypothetical protein